MNKAKPGFAFLLLFTLFSGFSVVGQKDVRGIIRDQGGRPLGGATISVKGADQATTSAADGSFIIPAVRGNILTFSFIGFKKREIRLRDETNIQVVLSESPDYLDEVVVTGYTSQKVKEITGSVTTVKPRDLTAVPASTFEQMLQGRVSGLTVVTSGEPGADSDIRIHGRGNFGDVTPLYIIDGVEGDINSLNPYDVESIQVLKDAGAYSIYGVRGSNGVIVVTTKSGRPGRTRIGYDFYVGYQQPLKKGLDMLSTQENADLLWMALKNSNLVDQNGNPYDPLYGNGPNPVLPDYVFAGLNIGLSNGDPKVDPALYNVDPSAPIYQIVPFNKAGTDWFHELFKPAWSQRHTLTVSGASEKNHYLLSFGYQDQQGTYLNTFLKTFTTRVNTQFAVLNSIRIGENIQLSYTQNPRAQNWVDPTPYMDPYIPVYDIMGNYGGYGPVQKFKPSPTSNPVAERELSKDDKDHRWQVFGNVYAELDFLKKFTVKTSIGGVWNFYNAYNYIYGTYELPPSGNYSFFNEKSGYSRFWIWTNTLRYSTTIAGSHEVKALLGTEQRSSYNREIGGSRKGYFIDDPNYRFLSTGSPDGQSNYGVAGTTFLASFFGQVSYGYKEKYFLSGTIRRDGASIFGPENRYGWFPSVGIAWRMTEEDFMKRIDWITELKLRGSWGKTGFYGNTDPYNQYTLYGGGPGSSYYAIDGTSDRIQQGFRMVRIGNAGTGWQEDININAGLEAVFWNGKLNLTVDWYDKRTEGLLFPLTLPALLGDATPPNVNVGNIKNTGIDVLLGSKGKFSRNWSWDLQVTFSKYNNKIVKLNELPHFDDWDWGGQPLVRNQIGFPVGSFFGYKIIGIFQNSEDVARSPVQDDAAEGRFKYADVNGRDSNGLLTGKPDGKITTDDRFHYGNPNPDFTLGLNIGFRFKDFDFSAFFYGSFGNDVLNHQKYMTDLFVLEGPKSKNALYNHWTPDRPDATIPKVEYLQNFSTASVVNSYRLENGSYFRSKSIILGYTFPKKWLERFRIERLRFYLQVANLITITDYSGLDPELSGLYGTESAVRGSLPALGIDFGNYPNNQRQWLAGLNLAF